MDITMAFDPASMAKLERMLHFEFGTTYTPVMNDSLELLESYATNIMQSEMINYTGELASNFVQLITPGLDAVTGELSNATAWAWRQEEGFSGRTDSLGRYFPHTPEYHYMQRSLDDNKQTIFDLFVTATQAKLATLGVL